MDELFLNTLEKLRRGELSPAEKGVLRNRIEEDPVLQEAASSYLLLLEGLEEEVQSDLKRNMQQWQKERDRKRKYQNVFKIVLVILLLSLVLFLGYRLSASQEPEWQEYAVVHLEEMRRSLDNNAVLQLNQLYQNNQFEEATRFISQLETTERKDVKVLFIQAMIAYKQGHIESAFDSFQTIKQRNSIPFYIAQQADFMSVLIQLQQNECNEECKKLLKKIAEDEVHLKQKEAKELSEKFLN